MKARLMVAISMMGIVGAFATPAHAATVAVTLKIAQYDYVAGTVSCDVSVGQGAGGLAVLDAARAKGCIVSYKTQLFGEAHFVSCIDDGTVGEECADPAPTYARYWDMRVNCTVTMYGVDDYKAHAGDELSFTYETYPTSLVTASPEHPPTDCM
jgi:hypothetical protein